MSAKTQKPLVITVASRKGGVGKTTVAGALGSLAASHGLKTLLVDLDPQSNLVWGLSGDLSKTSQTYNLLTKEPFEPTQIGENPRLFGLCGSPNLKDESIQRLDPECLEDVLSNLEGSLKGFEVIIVDCPPNLDRLEALGLAAADVALLAMDPHPFAQTGALRVFEYIEKRKARGRSAAERVAVVISKVDLRRALDRVAETLTPSEALPSFTIRQDANLATASALREEIMTFSPKTKAVEDLERLWEWIRG